MLGCDQEESYVTHMTKKASPPTVIDEWYAFLISFPVGHFGSQNMGYGRAGSEPDIWDTK